MAYESLKDTIIGMIRAVVKYRDPEAKRELFHGLILVLRWREGKAEFLAVRKATAGKAHLVMVEGSANRRSYLQEAKTVEEALVAAGLVATNHLELNKDGWTGHSWTVAPKPKEAQA